MDLLALLGLSYVFRRLGRRGRGQGQPDAPNATPGPATTTISAPPPAHPRPALLVRAARGLLLAGLLLLLALIPWPTAWATSAALLPHIQPWRQSVLDNIDVLTVSLVVIATIEPLLVRLLSAIWQAPRLLALLVQLGWVQSRIGYWRYRNWRRCAVAR